MAPNTRPARLRIAGSARERTRTAGWAANDEESQPGARTVAAPVLGPDRVASAAVAVQGPAVRVDAGDVARLAALVQAEARSVAPLLTP